MINKVTILGERCSGTNYLENLLIKNFEVEITWKYGHKHFFGFEKYEDSDDVLFVCIIRDPFEWINSLWSKPWHFDPELTSNIFNFVYGQIKSYYYTIDKKLDMQNQIVTDRNFLTSPNPFDACEFKNILELRYAKLFYQLEQMPKLVKNYIFIRYEDLIENFNKTLWKIKHSGLKIKPGINFPLNESQYKKENKKYKYIKKDFIPVNLIIYHPYFNFDLEKKLGYV